MFILTKVKETVKTKANNAKAIRIKKKQAQSIARKRRWRGFNYVLVMMTSRTFGIIAILIFKKGTPFVFHLSVVTN